MTTTNPLEVVQNLILDTIEPFVDRITDMQKEIEDLKHGLKQRNLAGTDAEDAMREGLRDSEAASGVREAKSPSNVSSDRLQAVLDLHRLDAVPQQWVFKNGKREAAPDGMWEITCAVCSDHKIDWMQGDPEPPRCKTIKLLTG